MQLYQSTEPLQLEPRVLKCYAMKCVDLHIPYPPYGTWVMWPDIKPGRIQLPHLDAT